MCYALLYMIVMYAVITMMTKIIYVMHNYIVPYVYLAMAGSIIQYRDYSNTTYAIKIISISTFARFSGKDR